MPSLYRFLEAMDTGSGRIHVVIDTPKGSRGKYKYDEASGIFRLSKLLPLGACFPCNYGFVPSTRSEDGDALDMLVLMDEPAVMASVVTARLMGVMKAEQTERDGKVCRNDRLIGILETDYNPAGVLSLEALGQQWLKEMEYFFVSYNHIEGRHFAPLGYGGAEEALGIIREGARRYGSSAKAA